MTRAPPSSGIGNSLGIYLVLPRHLYVNWYSNVRTCKTFTNSWVAPRVCILLIWQILIDYLINWQNHVFFTIPPMYFPVCIAIINPWHACAARVTVVGCVCVPVSQHLTSGASVCLEITVTYSTGKKGKKKVCGGFTETTLLQRSSTSRIVQLFFVGHFSLCGKRTCARAKC